MEGMASVWGYQESVDELKHRLLCTTLELESLRTNANEEMRRNEENFNQLIQLLKLTSQERDEARDQLQRLLNKLMQPNPVEFCPIVSHLQHESLQIRPTGGNSNTTDSDSFSETHNYHSYVSSPVESFFDTVSSPELSNINIIDSSNMVVPHQPFIPDYNSSTSMGISPGVAKFDKASAIIDRLGMKKTLPEKGKLLQAVMEAGPLLQTLLVAGPLPRWRNPPPLHPFHLPPVTVKAHNTEMLNHTAIVDPNSLAQSSPTVLHHEKSNGVSQIYSPSPLDSSSTVNLSLRKRPIFSSCVSNYQSFTGKRQKAQ